MTNLTIFFSLLLILFILPVYLYGRRGRWMARFCIRMTLSSSYRKFYCYIAVMVAILTQFIYYRATGLQSSLFLPSLGIVMIFSMLRLTWTEHVIRTLAHDSLLMWLFTIATLSVAFIPDVLSISILMAIIIIGASFYPSEKIFSLDRQFLIEYLSTCSEENDYTDFIGTYFSQPSSSLKLELNSIWNRIKLQLRKVRCILRHRLCSRKVKR